MLTKPENGGMPTSDSANTAKHPAVTGIARPTPASSETLVQPVCLIRAPAARNSPHLVTAWNTMCSSPPVKPPGVSSASPNRIYDTWLTVE